MLGSVILVLFLQLLLVEVADSSENSLMLVEIQSTPIEIGLTDKIPTKRNSKATLTLHDG